MADRIVTKADRTPNWGKWRWKHDAPLWHSAALFLNTDPDLLGIDDDWAGKDHILNEPQEFQGLLIAAEEAVLSGELRAKSNGPECLFAPRYRIVNIREFFTWARENRCPAPELIVVKECLADPAPSEGPSIVEIAKPTDQANAARQAKKAERLKFLNLLTEDVYKALDRAGHDIGESGDRKPLPVSVAVLHTLFLVRHLDRGVTKATFNDDLTEIGVLIQRGRKRLTADDVVKMLAKTSSG